MTEELSAKAVREGLETRVIGRKVLYHASLPSTMDAAVKEARRGAQEGTVVIAGEQSAGRGRLNRAWLAPGGNVALSVILRPEKDLLPEMIMLASLSVVKAIESVTRLKPVIKWPNDVLIGGKKVCGILIENDFRGSEVSHSIIGIGIDVNLRLADHPEIRDIATSLADKTGKEVSRLAVIKGLLREMDVHYNLMLSGAYLYSQWRSRLVTLGKRVRVTDGDKVYEGTAESADPNGSLLLRQDNGALKVVVAGDVTLRE